MLFVNRYLRKTVLGFLACGVMQVGFSNQAMSEHGVSSDYELARLIKSYDAIPVKMPQPKPWDAEPSVAETQTVVAHMVDGALDSVRRILPDAITKVMDKPNVSWPSASWIEPQVGKVSAAFQQIDALDLSFYRALLRQSERVNMMGGLRLLDAQDYDVSFEASAHDESEGRVSDVAGLLRFKMPLQQNESQQGE